MDSKDENTEVSCPQEQVLSETSTSPPSRTSRSHDKEPEKSRKSEFNARAVGAVAGSALAICCTIGFINAFGVLIDYYAGHQLKDKTAFQITWLGSFNTFIFFIFTVPAGILVDRIGPTIPMAIGGITFLVSMFMISLCSNYWQLFLAQGLLQGIGSAFMTCPCLATVGKHFVKHKGLASGFMISGSSLGGVVWPIMLNELLNKHGLSFGWTIRILAFTMIPLVIVACSFVLPPKVVKADHEEGRETTKEDEEEKTKKKVDLSSIKDPKFGTFAAGIGIYYLGMFGPFFFVTSYAVSIGISTEFSFYLVSIMNAASLFGRMSGGWLADKYGPFNVICMAGVSSAVVGYCWTAATSYGSLTVWAVAYGYSAGSVMSLQVASAIKLSTPETYGTTMGLVFGLSSLTGLFGSPIAGELIKYNYLALSMYIASTLILGSFLIGISRILQSRTLFKIV